MLIVYENKMIYSILFVFEYKLIVHLEDRLNYDLI